MTYTKIKKKSKRGLVTALALTSLATPLLPGMGIVAEASQKEQPQVDLVNYDVQLETTNRGTILDIHHTPTFATRVQ